MYVNSSHFYAVRNPFWNNAIGNTFKRLNTYIVAKHTFANQLVLTFYRRVTPVFMNSTRESARRCWLVQVAPAPVNSPDVAFLSAQSMQERTNNSHEPLTTCSLEQTVACPPVNFSSWAPLSLVADITPEMWRHSANKFTWPFRWRNDSSRRRLFTDRYNRDWFHWEAQHSHQTTCDREGW